MYVISTPQPAFIPRPGFAEALQKSQLAKAERDKAAAIIPAKIAGETMAATREVVAQKEAETMAFWNKKAHERRDVVFEQAKSQAVSLGYTPSQATTMVEDANAEKRKSDFSKIVGGIVTLAGAGVGASAAAKSPASTFLPQTSTGKLDIGSIVKKGLDIVKSTISGNAAAPGNTTTTGTPTGGQSDNNMIVILAVAFGFLFLFGKKLFK